MLGIHDPWYRDSGTENGSRSTALSAAMGFRSLLKGLRASDKRNTSTASPSQSTSAVATDKSETISIAANNSTLQPVGPISGASVTSRKDDKPRDLWDEAWTMLSKDDPKLKQMYEDIILIEGEEDNKSDENNLGKSRKKFLSPIKWLT